MQLTCVVWKEGENASCWRKSRLAEVWRLRIVSQRSRGRQEYNRIASRISPREYWFLRVLISAANLCWMGADQRRARRGQGEGCYHRLKCESRDAILSCAKLSLQFPKDLTSVLRCGV